MRTKFLVACLAFVSVAGSLFAPTITLRASGFWTLRLKATDLSGGAGTDFSGTYPSDVNLIKLTITKTVGPTAPWRMDIRKVDTVWHMNLHIYAQRTSDGTGDGTITGGLSYQEISDTDQSFFSGTGDRSSVEVQLQLTGVTASLGANDFTTTIYYTVVET